MGGSASVIRSGRDRLINKLKEQTVKRRTTEELARQNPIFNKLHGDWWHINGHVKKEQGGADPRNGPEGGMYNTLSPVFGSEHNWPGDSQFRLVGIGGVGDWTGVPRLEFAIIDSGDNMDKVYNRLLDTAIEYDADFGKYPPAHVFYEALQQFANEGWLIFKDRYDDIVSDAISRAEAAYEKLDYPAFEENVKNLKPAFIKEVNELLDFLRRTGKLDEWPFYWTGNLDPNNIDPRLFTGPDGYNEFLRTVDALRSKYFDGPGLETRKPSAEDVARADAAGFKLEEIYDTPEALAEALAKLDEHYEHNYTHFSKFGYQNLSNDDYALAQENPEAFDDKLKHYRPEMTFSEQMQQKAYEEALAMGSQILGGGVTSSSASAANVQDQITKLQESAAALMNQRKNEIQGGDGNSNNNNNSNK